MIIKSLSCEEEKIIKNIKSFFRLKSEQNYTGIKDLRNLFRLEEETKQLKIEYLEILRIFLSMKKKIIINPRGVSNFQRKNYIKYESSNNKNKKLSVEEYLNKIGPYLKDINNLEESETLKIQPTIAINFVSCIDNDEEHVMNSKTDNIEILIYDKANEVIKKLFNELNN